MFMLFLVLQSLLREGAWFADCAQMWLSAPPLLPSKSGHVFSSMQAKPGSTFRLAQSNGYTCENEYWKCNWLDGPGKKNFLSPPLYFPRSSKCLAQCVEEISATMLSEQSVPESWYWIWDLLGEKIVEHKICLDILSPDAVTLCSSCPSKLFAHRPNNRLLESSIQSAFALEQVPWLHFQYFSYLFFFMVSSGTQGVRTFNT